MCPSPRPFVHSFKIIISPSLPTHILLPSPPSLLPSFLKHLLGVLASLIPVPLVLALPGQEKRHAPASMIRGGKEKK